MEFLKNFSCLFIKIYQLFSAFRAPVCKFNPTCSHYAILAIKKYGFIIGWKLAIKRIASCHPFSKGGYDPVP